LINVLIQERIIDQIISKNKKLQAMGAKTDSHKLKRGATAIDFFLPVWKEVLYIVFHFHEHILCSNTEK